MTTDVVFLMSFSIVPSIGCPIGHPFLGSILCGSVVNCNQSDRVWRLGYDILHVKNSLSTNDKNFTRFVYSDGPSKLQETSFSS